MQSSERRSFQARSERARSRPTLRSSSRRQSARKANDLVFEPRERGYRGVEQILRQEAEHSKKRQMHTIDDEPIKCKTVLGLCWPKKGTRNRDSGGSATSEPRIENHAKASLGVRWGLSRSFASPEKVPKVLQSPSVLTGADQQLHRNRFAIQSTMTSPELHGRFSNDKMRDQQIEQLDSLASAGQVITDEQKDAVLFADDGPRRTRSLLRKQDCIIMPLMSLGYMFNYLDRAIIGNARIMGLQKSLHLTNSEYFNCLMIYFISFCVAELPLALLLRKLPANFVFGAAIIIFGLVTVLISQSGGYAGLMVLRTLLGVAEAATTTGFLYLTLFYKQDELALRSGIFFASSAVAGLFGGLVAWAVAKNLGGHNGLHAWQWLFIVMGAPAIGLGIVVCLFLPGLPDQIAKKPFLVFRNPDERALILKRMVETQNGPDVKIQPRQILVALKDFKSWLGAFILGGSCVANTAFVVFLPTFIKEDGYSALVTQLITMIPYGFAIASTLLCCLLSDRSAKRFLPTFVCLSACSIGLILLMTTTNKLALIAGCCFVAAGSTPCVPISAAWILSIHAGYTKKSTVFAINMIVVQMYAVMASKVYNTPPRFLKGHAVILGVVGLSLISSLIMFLHLTRENKSRDAIADDYRKRGEEHPLASESLEVLYDFHPNFRYCL